MSVAALQKLTTTKKELQHRGFPFMEIDLEGHFPSLLEELSEVPDLPEFLSEVMEALDLSDWKAPLGEYIDFVWLLAKGTKFSLEETYQRTIGKLTNSELQEEIRHRYEGWKRYPEPGRNCDYRPYLLNDVFTGDRKSFGPREDYEILRREVFDYSPQLVKKILECLEFGHSYRPPYFRLASIPLNPLEPFLIRHENPEFLSQTLEVVPILKDLRNIVASYLTSGDLLSVSVGMIITPQLSPRSEERR